MERVCIDKVLLDPVTMNEAVDRVSGMLDEERERAAHVVTMNAQFVEIAHQEERFAELLRRADLSVADGALAGVGLALARPVCSGACRGSGFDDALMRNSGVER